MTRSNAYLPSFGQPTPHAAAPTASNAAEPAEAAQPERVPAERWWVERLARRHPIIDVLREDRQLNDGLTTPGFQALAAHRLSRWAADGDAPRWLRRPVGALAGVGEWVARSVYGIELPSGARVGRRVRIAHQSGIVVHRDAVVGDDVIIRQNVTIGLHRDDVETHSDNVPTIGDGVSLGAGAVVVGPVTVGEGARVGANALVTQDVPPGGKAVLPPSVVSGPQGERPR